MGQFSRYIKNRRFLDWVNNPNDENNRYWKAYIADHPDEEETICTLKSILLSLRPDDIERLDSMEKEELFSKILSALENREENTKVRRLIPRFYKYAAVLVMALGLGYYFIEPFQGTDEFPIGNMPNAAIESISETQLILNSGEQFLISNNQSTVEYTASGNVVVNSNDTLNTDSKTAIKDEFLNQLIVPYGRRSKISLEDGTIVHLNAGSRFIFPKVFTGKERKVFLEGEAFFEVATNKNRPFIVKTLEKDFEIQVVGTRFNVSSYAADDEILTVLTEGEVHINKEINPFYSEKTKLKPGELASWSKSDKKVGVKTVNTDNYTLWVEGILQFKSLSVFDVAKKIERFYNIEILMEETLSKNIRISGKLDLHNDLVKTMESFAMVSTLEFEKVNDKKYLFE